MILEIQEKTGPSLRRICQILHVPRSGFYHAAKPSARELADSKKGKQIQVIFKRHRGRYGYRRIWRQMAEEGVICSARCGRRIMKERGLRAIAPKTSDGKALKPAPNLLANRCLPSLPNEIWTADITYIPTISGWLYLAVVMDLCTRKILGWKLANHMRSELVIEAFNQALRSTRSVKSAIFHSDRGSQYGSYAFRSILERAGAL